ncbi:MAG: ParB/RepB/Spo0J family partition protein [Capsulimonadaceae bacterium]|nr:ParB/RepB/Spo0J family partition protein [Capsulimonadaceae bacterium]
MTNEKAPKRGLGRGLSHLIPGAAVPVDAAALPEAAANTEEGMRMIPLTKIALNPYQPRESFAPDELADLTESIKEHGVLQPIVVRPKRPGAWELVAGERRFRAATAAGLKDIPAVVKDLDDRSALALAVIENIQRENLNAIEAARAYKRLQDEFGLNQSQVAREVGKPQPTVANALRLLQLPEPVVASVASGEITEGHGKAILAIDDDESRVRLWREVVDKKLNVRETERRASAIRNAPREIIPRGITNNEETLHIEALEEDLSLVLGAKTRIRMTKPNRGVVEVAFYEREELDAIIDRLLRR